MSTVKEDLVNMAVENLRACLAAEDARRAELVHQRAITETAYQSFTYAVEKTTRARIGLDKLLGGSGAMGPIAGVGPSSGRTT